MALKKTINSPATYSDYTQLIKSCLRHYSHETANYIAARLKYFRQNISETRNFKVTIFEGSRKLLVFKVRGGYGSMFTSKYKVTEMHIVRYDWRHSFWEKVCTFVIRASYFAEAICHFIPGAQIGIPAIRAIRKGAAVGRFASQNRPARAALEYVKPDDYSFVRNYF